MDHRPEPISLRKCLEEIIIHPEYKTKFSAIYRKGLEDGHISANTRRHIWRYLYRGEDPYGTFRDSSSSSSEDEKGET